MAVGSAILGFRLRAVDARRRDDCPAIGVFDAEAVKSLVRAIGAPLPVTIVSGLSTANGTVTTANLNLRV